MSRKLDILKIAAGDEAKRLDVRLGETESDGELFPDGFSASNATHEVSQVRISEG